MSNIFDALLKSEQDQAGTAESAQASAPEMLVRAEQRVVAERRAKLASEGLAPFRTKASLTVERLDDDSTVQTLAHSVLKLLDGTAGTVADLPEISAPRDKPALRSEGPDGLPDPLSQFQTIRPELPVGSPLIAVTDKNCPTAEAFRLLCVRLKMIRNERQLRSLLITSTIPQEGKSFSAANLVCTIAAVTGQKVLLMEGDLRRPVQSDLFHLRNLPGLREWLEGKRELRDTVYYLDGPNFWLMPAGACHSNPLDLLQSERLTSTMDLMSKWFDWIIIDSPPVLPLADTSVLSRLSDGTLLVTRRGTTEKRLLQRGLHAIEKEKMLGVIINSSLQEHSSYYYYGAPTSSSKTDAA